MGSEIERLKAFVDRLERDTNFLSVFLDNENYNLVAKSNHRETLSSITSAIYGLVALQIRSAFFDGHRDDDIDFKECLDADLFIKLKKKHKNTIDYLKKSSDKAIAHLTSFDNNSTLQTYDLLKLCYDLIDLTQDAMNVDINVQIQKRKNNKEKSSSLFEKIIME